MYCYHVLREPLLGVLITRVKACLAAESDWQSLEACLHGIFAVAESVNSTESQHLPELFTILPSIPFAKLDIQVAITVLDIIGELMLDWKLFKAMELDFVNNPPTWNCTPQALF